MQGQMMDNNSYNIIQALASSLEALEAYRKYGKDGNSQLWEQLAQHQSQIIQLLQRELPNIAQGGQSQSYGQGSQSSGQSGQNQSYGQGSSGQNYGATASQGQGGMNPR